MPLSMYCMASSSLLACQRNERSLGIRALFALGECFCLTVGELERGLWVEEM